MQHIQRGSTVRLPGSERVHTVLQLLPGDLAFVDDLGYPVRLEEVERVTVIEVGGIQVLRNGRGTFEVREVGFPTIEEAARYVAQLGWEITLLAVLDLDPWLR